MSCKRQRWAYNGPMLIFEQGIYRIWRCMLVAWTLSARRGGGQLISNRIRLCASVMACEKGAAV